MSKTMTKTDDTWRAYLDSLGTNAAFVEGLIHQYLENPAQVDERWRRAFDAVKVGKNVSTTPSETEVRERGEPLPSRQSSVQPPKLRESSAVPLDQLAASSLDAF